MQKDGLVQALLLLAVFVSTAAFGAYLSLPSTGEGAAVKTNFGDFVPKALVILVALILTAYACVVLWKIATDRIDLKELLEEDGGGASLARFQMLVFTFVIALGYFLFIIKAVNAGGGFPTLDDKALALIGISGGTYLLAKGIQKAGAQPGAEDSQPSQRINTNP